MRYTGKKLSSTQWTSTTFQDLRVSMGSPGTAAFMSMTSTSTSASSRTTIGNNQGLYSAFFTQTNITKIALVDGSSSSTNPTTHTNYLIYDLVESSGSESINDILKRLDIYQRDAPFFHNNDTVWGTPSVRNHTAGINGYSGLLSASGGTAFLSNNGTVPGRFCVMGINRDSDNDIQALCAFSGNLNTGKGDSWRNQNPSQTFWSFWGHDFYRDSKTIERIGASLQTAPGIDLQQGVRIPVMSICSRFPNLPKS